MSSHNKNQSKKWNQYVTKMSDLCHLAADALGISDGEFWVWYGNPFILQRDSHK